MSEPIRRYIREKRWESLRAIQQAAIVRIMGTEDNYILASRTASGKTEAAFLPVLSKVDFKEPGVQVLYISPLIALINDQFVRCEDLCKHLDIPVTKWHGEANKSGKDKLIANPRGVVLITPESIEAMLVNHAGRAKHLFSNLKFIIIDEIHTFLGTDRGTHLQSLISRIGRLKTGAPVRIIGLSATIGKDNYQVAKSFTGNANQTKVLVDTTAKETAATFKYVPSDAEYTVAFMEELYELTKDKKVLVFPNSRGRAEEVAVKLSKMAERKKGHPYYFSHHSSVDKSLREYVEHFAKTNERHNFCISCTSTLELGIDIGAVDLVVQIDATASVASLVQRIGRSGRREGLISTLMLYATNGWQLLQSLSCWLLYRSEFIEPVLHSDKPYDLLFHQILSTLKETNGISKTQLVQQLLTNSAFRQITESEINNLLQYMIMRDYVEDLHRELIIGYEGEKLSDNKEFFAVFTTPTFFKVVHDGTTVGELPFIAAAVKEDANIFLAARIWKIIMVDTKARKIRVEPARDGKKPIFTGDGADVHPKIREKMMELLYSELPLDILDETAVIALEELRFDFKSNPLNAQAGERPYIRKEEVFAYYTFTGSRINRTIKELLSLAYIGCEKYDEEESVFVIKMDACSPEELPARLLEILPTLEDVVQEELEELERARAAAAEKATKKAPAVKPAATKSALEAAAEKAPVNEATTDDDDDLEEDDANYARNSRFPTTKWGRHLPPDLQTQLILATWFDIPGTEAFLQQLKFVKC
ncbi:DEAD/DEAH box helicase [Chitinophaga agrisoli]|uniref:DEAD/DEAH box helicase n=1 Tax=Chitinophaga agrisoli TaxID=2607653 RepID=UPI001BC92937|nr:DEAD/DEAH box helicase [Chitinophaga agrisoli]